MTLLLLVGDDENRRILANWLSEEYDIVEEESPLETQYDLCIVDEASFRRHADALAETKERAGSTFLPHLLVASEATVSQASESLGDLPVDGVVEAPIRKGELAQRIRTLLQIRELSTELTARNERLEELNRINAAIRSINRVLIGASSREEIEQAVVDRLAGIDTYATSWIGHLDPGGQEIVQQARAGDGSRATGSSEGPLSRIENDTVRRAIESNTVVTLADQASATESGQRDATEKTDSISEYDGGTGSAGVAAPITFKNNQYGALFVGANRADAFAEEERSVLRELGETVGLAINAAERKKALLATQRVEVELRMEPVEEFLHRTSRQFCCSFSLEGIVASSDGRYLQYFSVANCSPDDVVAAAEAADAIEHVKRVGEEARLEIVFAGDSLVTTLAEHGATIDELSIDDGVGTVTMRFPHDTDVRGVYDAIRTDYPETELLARREVELSVDARRDFERTLDDDLTDHQRAALRTAFHAGFFDWPRDSTGEEVADSLDVSPATFHQHIRNAERKLFSSLFLEA